MSRLAPAPSRSFQRAKLLALAEHSATGEDRWTSNPARGTWVLCDGASEGWDSGGWAETLANRLAHLGPCDAAIIRARRDYARLHKDSTDWLSNLARKRGSWTTALVVEVAHSGRFLKASAFGDTTLFILEGYEKVLSFPMEDSKTYSNTPDLIEARGVVLPNFRSIVIPLAGLRRPSFALATDALAARLLENPEEEQEKLWRFFSKASPQAFATWAKHEMDASQLSQDDLTLLWVH